MKKQIFGLVLLLVVNSIHLGGIRPSVQTHHGTNVATSTSFPIPPAEFVTKTEVKSNEQTNLTGKKESPATAKYALVKSNTELSSLVVEGKPKSEEKTDKVETIAGKLDKKEKQNNETKKSKQNSEKQKKEEAKGKQTKQQTEEKGTEKNETKKEEKSNENKKKEEKDSNETKKKEESKKIKKKEEKESNEANNTAENVKEKTEKKITNEAENDKKTKEPQQNGKKVTKEEKQLQNKENKGTTDTVTGRNEKKNKQQKDKENKGKKTEQGKPNQKFGQKQAKKGTISMINPITKEGKVVSTKDLKVYSFDSASSSGLRLGSKVTFTATVESTVASGVAAIAA